MDELEKRHARWCKSLQRAVETDGWGQVVEAVEAYERLATQLVKEAAQFDDLSSVQMRTLEKVAGALELRAKCLSSVADGDRASPTKEDMEDILEVLCSVLSDAPKVFPADLGNVSRPAKRGSTVQVVEMDDADNDADDIAAAAATLALDAATNQPARTAAAPRRAGETYVSVQIAKIGLKDAPTYTNPTIVVSVFDRDGRAMGETAETIVGTHISAEPQHVSFQSSLRIELEPSVQDMEARGAAIFFEFYHYKPKKRKKSCRCWTLLEMDEVAAVRTTTSSSCSAPLALELYEKPMDPKRKRINLFTVKELYLHVHIALHTHTDE